jgi:Tfp pilus assembly protein PilX
MRSTMRSQRGSAVIIAVMAMLIMGVLSISFALLADIESRVGVSYKQQAQAEALAEAALERARDQIRTAPLTPGGFTPWFDGTTATHNLFTNLTLGPGQYSARIDNDCAAVNTVPAAIQEPPHGVTPCNNTGDFNEVGVITAWATAGTGRSRVRAVVGVDNPWKHVCSDAKPDNNGYCNEPGNRNGSPTVTPADPNDPNGPQAYSDLPRPVLGCSRIATDGVLHRGPYTTVQQQLGCTVSWPGIYAYPYPVPNNQPPRFVLMGEDPALVPTAKKCNVDPVNAAIFYFGYYDCALSTWCDPSAPFNQVCPPGGKPGFPNAGMFRACVRAGDSRLVSDPIHYGQYMGGGVCGGGASWETGMVFSGNTNFNTDVGSPSRSLDVYVYRGNWNQGNNHSFYGTLVVEGTPVGGTVFQVGNGADTHLWAGANVKPAPVGWVDPTTSPSTNNNSYGYPLVALIYNPEMPPPTISPTYAPQNTFADFGSANTDVHGMIYSGGHVQFNPLSFDGTVVAFEIQTQGSATYNYNPFYGNDTPPPGFPFGTANQVVIIRKSFVVCSNYNNDVAGATACN